MHDIAVPQCLKSTSGKVARFSIFSMHGEARETEQSQKCDVIHRFVMIQVRWES
jgi:hypothetical protein